MRPEICIYHAPCADGFGSAYALWRRFPDCKFVPASYGDDPPDVTGKNVVVVDFSYKAPVLRSMSEAARSLLIIDHHKTAAEDLQFLPKALDGLPPYSDPWLHFTTLVAAHCHARHIPHVGAVFDMEKSGARLTWEFFHSGCLVPNLILHIEDRDLWRFYLPGTREIFSAVMSHPYDFSVWDRLMRMAESTSGRGELFEQGAAIERKHQKDVAEIIGATRRMMKIGGYNVPVANMPFTMASDGAGAMTIGYPFAATYYDAPDGRRFSLRSRGEDGVDVSEIAKRYGGGGHRNAAGFTAPRGWEGEE